MRSTLVILAVCLALKVGFDFQVAEAVFASSCESSAWSKVVLPVPTSPVSTQKPLPDCTA